MITNLRQYKRHKCANELGFLASFLEEDTLKDLIFELADSMTEREEVTYICARQNKQAAKSKL